MTAVLEARPVDGALDDGACSGSVRLVRVEAFEPAVYVAPEHRDAYERRFVTLLVDEASRRRGGVGEVLHARNPRGERFALKRLRRSDGEGGDEGLAEARRAAFDAEYDAHRTLSPLRGFPRLYGRGRVGEDSAIVMEWVEGVTLEEAARALAVDDEGRLSPLTVARIGRDLFDLLARMAYVEGGLAHRDVAPRNIMIDTGQLSAADQVEEGAFQLVLVDFGSAVPLESADPSLTARWGAPLGATADFAAPEMLTDDVSGAVARRRSPAVDVYAAASVLYQLMEGHSPYDLSFAGRSQREGRSAYRIKTEFSPEMPAGAHGSAADVRAVLALEPEVAVAVGRAAAELDGAPAPHRVRAALSAVDDQLAEVLMACLVPEQSRRPRAREVREALALFCSQYADNVARALRGESLAPCPLGGAAVTEARRRRRLRRAARVAADALSAAVAVGGAVTAGLLTQGMTVAFPSGQPLWSGPIPGLAVSAALLLPLAGALIARGSERDTGFGFVRGLLGSLLGGTVAGLLASLAVWPSESVLDALYAVLFLAVVAPLPGLAADWALALPRLSSASSTTSAPRPVLPWGAVPSEDRAISTASREALALETMSEITYELADETNEEGV